MHWLERKIRRYEHRRIRLAELSQHEVQSMLRQLIAQVSAPAA